MKTARVTEALALGLIPLLCMTALCSMAFLSGRHQSGISPTGRRYDMSRFMADARQAAALFHYLTEIEPPISTTALAQNSPSRRPLLTQSNYTFLLTTNKADPI